jgi:hypothetical protein
LRHRTAFPRLSPQLLPHGPRELRNGPRLLRRALRGERSATRLGHVAIRGLHDAIRRGSDAIRVGSYAVRRGRNAIRGGRVAIRRGRAAIREGGDARGVGAGAGARGCVANRGDPRAEWLARCLLHRSRGSGPPWSATSPSVPLLKEREGLSEPVMLVGCAVRTFKVVMVCNCTPYGQSASQSSPFSFSFGSSAGEQRVARKRPFPPLQGEVRRGPPQTRSGPADSAKPPSWPPPVPGGGKIWISRTIHTSSGGEGDRG